MHFHNPDQVKGAQGANETAGDGSQTTTHAVGKDASWTGRLREVPSKVVASVLSLTIAAAAVAGLSGYIHSLAKTAVQEEVEVQVKPWVEQAKEYRDDAGGFAVTAMQSAVNAALEQQKAAEMAQVAAVAADTSEEKAKEARDAVAKAWAASKKVAAEIARLEELLKQNPTLMNGEGEQVLQRLKELHQKHESKLNKIKLPEKKLDHTDPGTWPEGGTRPIPR